MNNPYEVLGISQNATKNEILKARTDAMKARVFRLPDIHIAEKQLLNPTLRLAADFISPTRIKANRILWIHSEWEETIDIQSIDENMFNSLVPIH